MAAAEQARRVRDRPRLAQRADGVVELEPGQPSDQRRLGSRVGERDAAVRRPRLRTHIPEPAAQQACVVVADDRRVCQLDVGVVEDTAPSSTPPFALIFFFIDGTGVLLVVEAKRPRKVGHGYLGTRRRQVPERRDTRHECRRIGFGASGASSSSRLGGGMWIECEVDEACLDAGLALRRGEHRREVIGRRKLDPAVRAVQRQRHRQSRAVCVAP